MNTSLIRNLSLAIASGAAVATQAAVPSVSTPVMSQDATSRHVTITYTLSDAPAVITLDVQTNATANASADDPGWTSIGGAAVGNATGDVWQEVAIGAHTIKWRPDHSWPDHVVTDNRARAVVTAWALDNTPDYMVVDISSAAQQNTQKYYPGADFLPGGLLGNPDYRTTSVVMRKIMAKDVEWTMGSTTLETKRTAASEATHKVSLTNNYYIGVFEVTQAQWDLIQPTRTAPSYFNNAADRAMRPVEMVCYNEIRTNSGTSVDPNATYYWPADPNPSSFLGKLRTRTGIDFDLPSEAQWEFAARACNGDTKWGDGSGILNTDEDANLGLLGRYQYNGGKVWNGSSYVAPDQSCDASNGTAIVGSYAPNAWGLYDMHGNVWEWCLDWYADNISANGGRVNIDPAAPSKTLSGASTSDRVRRGGGSGNPAGNCRPARRGNDYSGGRGDYIGFRLLCLAGLQ